MGDTYVPLHLTKGETMWNIVGSVPEESLIGESLQVHNCSNKQPN